MVRTRSAVHNNPTVMELKRIARASRRQEWLSYYETIEQAIRAGEIKDYFAGSTVGEDEDEQDRFKLCIRLLYGFPFEEYIAVTKEVPIVTLLMRELDKSLNREAYPGQSEALVSDCTEEEVKGFMVARRALVCSYLEKLQSFREKVTVQEKGWTEGLSIYKAMALSLFREYLDTLAHLLFLSGESLINAVIGHTQWAKENVLPVVQMLMTAFRDDNVAAPVLFEHFPAAGETFLSFRSTLEDEVKEKLKNEVNEEKVEGAAAFHPGMSSTLRDNKPALEKKDLQKQQRLTAIFEDEDLSPEQKYFMMEYIRQADHEEDNENFVTTGKMGEDEDPLEKRFHLRLEETDHELYSSPQPHSSQYHSLPDVKLPKFHGNPLEFHKFYSMFLCLVDRNPKIPKIMKLHLLNDALRGTASYLTHQITYAPGSYDQLKHNLLQAFGDTESALSQLRERLNAWPMIPEDKYTDLAKFYGFATNYVMSLLQYDEGASFNARGTLHDLYCKFNQSMRHNYQWSLEREETLKGKLADRAKLDFMLHWLDKQVSMARTFYHADPKNPKLPLGMPSGIAMEFGKNRGKPNNERGNGRGGGSQAKQNSEPIDTTTVLATDTVATRGGATRGGRGRGRGRGGTRGARGRGRGGRGGGGGSSTHPATSTIDQSASTSGSNDDREVVPCCFCNNPRHSSHLCTQKMKPDTVYIKALEFQLCLNCLRAGHWASSCPYPGCGRDNCNGRHHRMMHGRSKDLAPTQNS